MRQETFAAWMARFAPPLHHLTMSTRLLGLFSGSLARPPQTGRFSPSLPPTATQLPAFAMVLVSAAAVLAARVSTQAVQIDLAEICFLLDGVGGPSRRCATGAAPPQPCLCDLLPFSADRGVIGSRVCASRGGVPARTAKLKTVGRAAVLNMGLAP